MQPPAKPAHECMPLDVHCAICADNICQGCSFPFQVNQWGKCGGLFVPHPALVPSVWHLLLQRQEHCNLDLIKHLQ